MKIAGWAARLLRAVAMGALLAPCVMAGTVPADVCIPEAVIFRSAEAKAPAYEVEVVPLERAGCRLHLTCTKKAGTSPSKDILLIHGLTYSSHQFDVDVEDYSLARFLTGQGYAVWLLDIAGYGQSGSVRDGFLPDSDYAALDIHAAAKAIQIRNGNRPIDVLGWSWGTVTTSRFAAKHPEMVNRLVLYAPILTGLGAAQVDESFHANTWEHAADDFRKNPDGSINTDILEPKVAAVYFSNCWRYDGHGSPNGGRRDLLVSDRQRLIFPEQLRMPVLVIEGSEDGYINRRALQEIQPLLPNGSALIEIEGGAHAMLIEKPFYKEFRRRLMEFLNKKD